MKRKNRKRLTYGLLGFIVLVAIIFYAAVNHSSEQDIYVFARGEAELNGVPGYAYLAIAGNLKTVGETFLVLFLDKQIPFGKNTFPAAILRNVAEPYSSGRWGEDKNTVVLRRGSIHFLKKLEIR